MDDGSENNHTKNLISDPAYRVNTIVINRYDSRCANCGENAFPDEGRHITVSMGKEIFVEHHDEDKEYIVPVSDKTEGCGAEWKFMYSEYRGVGIKTIAQEKFPQYEWIGFDDE